MAHEAQVGHRLRSEAVKVGEFQARGHRSAVRIDVELHPLCARGRVELHRDGRASLRHVTILRSVCIVRILKMLGPLSRVSMAISRIRFRDPSRTTVTKRQYPSIFCSDEPSSSWLPLPAGEDCPIVHRPDSHPRPTSARSGLASIGHGWVPWCWRSEVLHITTVLRHRCS